MIRLIAFLFCSLLSVAILAQDVRFEASTDARQVILSGYFTVSFTLYNANGENFKAPDFKGFSIMSGPSPTTSMRIVNGQRSQSYTISYQLQPRQLGRFQIKSASIKVGNKVLKTRPLSVEVVKGRNSNASTQEELQKEIQEQVFIKAIPTTTDAHVGQQVILDYKIYTSRDVENYNLLKESEYNGFYAEDLRRFNQREVKEVIDGVQYTTKVIKRLALFPQQAGVLTIEPLDLQLFVVLEDRPRPRSFFYTPKMTPVRVMTEPIDITVRPLPEDAPISFSGAVGKFKMRGVFNRNEMTTDDAVSLRMTISGDGDIKQIQPPRLDLPTSFEVYDPKVLEENSYDDRGIVAGEKTFEYLILPKEAGTYSLAPGFTYFDPDSARYVTLRADMAQLEVKQGQFGNRPLAQRDNAEDAPQDIRFIQTETSLRNGSWYFFGSGLFWGLFLLPFLVLGGIVVLRQRRAQYNNLDVAVRKSRQARKLAEKRMSLAKEYLEKQQSKPFYDEISRAAFGYICDKLRIPLAELSKDNVLTKLQSLSVSENLIERFMKIVQNCEMALFAGMDNTPAMRETYEETVSVIAAIEEEVGKA